MKIRSESTWRRLLAERRHERTNPTRKSEESDERAVLSFVPIVLFGTAVAGAVGGLAGRLLLNSDPADLRVTLILVGISFLLVGGGVGWAIWRTTFRRAM